MTQAEFIALAANRYEQIQQLNQLDSFYDYEKQFDQAWVGMCWKKPGRVTQGPAKKTPCAPDTEP